MYSNYLFHFGIISSKFLNFQMSKIHILFICPDFEFKKDSFIIAAQEPHQYEINNVRFTTIFYFFLVQTVIIFIICSIVKDITFIIELY